MLHAIAVELLPHDPRWAGMAADYAAGLGTLGPDLLAVHHIGSTSIAGIAAKPVIDLMPIVTDLEALDAAQGKVEALGYVWRGEFGIDGRRYCTLEDAAGKRLAQLHFYAKGSPHTRRHLAFRDYLRAFPEVAAAYEQEKHRARAIHPDNSHDYSAEKGAWIRATEAKALAWFDAGDALI
jgi:GrpB-like predicted nucleotidyltransferase (UPF0157 family)